MNDSSATDLIDELLIDSKRFFEKGLSYHLLQTYFNGYPINTLINLLKSDDTFVRRAAVFIASELGERAEPIVDHVIPLLESGDRYLEYKALEVLAACCAESSTGRNVHLALALENKDEVVRVLAMELLAQMGAPQLEGIRRSLEASGRVQPTHMASLSALLAIDGSSEETIMAMIHHSDPLIRRYGAIAAKRFMLHSPALFAGLGSSNDVDIREFYRSARE